MRHTLAPEHEAEAARAIEVLLDAHLEHTVDMVVVPRDDHFEVRAPDGAVRFRRSGSSWETLGVEGRDPLGRQDPAAFSPLPDERAELHPHRSRNSYPYAYEMVAQLFDSAAAPDVCVLHSAAHNWEDHGGHLGEHGSMGVVQARAPFVIGGKGVHARGLVDESCRLVDVAPTVAELLGCAADDEGHYLRWQDGEVLAGVLDPSARPAHVVGFLLDGTNANVLYDMIDRGEAPNIARILDMGTAYRHGAISALPTVTLANHTSILTGAYPGHHGILHNAWYDRATKRQIITNSSATWASAMDHLDPEVDTVFSAVHRTWPDAFTASCDEPCDKGAAFSTFDFFRRGEILEIPPAGGPLPHATERFVRPSKDYRWSSVVDHLCVEQAAGVWAGSYRGRTYPRPRFMWCNFTLTDAAMHEGGPHSDIAAAAVRDTDARIGEIMTAVEAAGSFDDTAFLVLADHGMEETDPACTGDWDAALRDAGVAVRDEGYGFLYFGVDPA